MKSKHHKLKKNTLTYFLSSLLNNGISFFLLPILTTYYSTEEYGVYSIIILTSTIIGGFFYFGASSSYSRFFFDTNLEVDKNILLSKVFRLSLYGGISSILLIFIFGDEISISLFQTKNYFIHILLSNISISLGFIVAIAMIDFQFRNKANIFLLLSLFGVLINFSITYLLLVFFGLGIFSPLIGILSSNLVIAIYFTVINFKKIKKYFNLNIDRKIILFGLNSAVMGILFYLIDYSDRYIINKFLSLSDVGIYSLGYKLGIIANVLIIVPFSYAWAPIRLQHKGDNDQSNYTKVIINFYFSLSSIFVVGTILFSKPIFNFIFVSKDYLMALKIAPIIMFSVILYGVTNVTNLGIYLKNKLWIQNFILLISLIINLSLNFLFVESYGILSAALTTLFSFSFMALSVSIISNYFKKIKINFFKISSHIILTFSFIIFYTFTDYLLLINIYEKILIIMILIFFSGLEFKKLKS